MLLCSARRTEIFEHELQRALFPPYMVFGKICNVDALAIDEGGLFPPAPSKDIDACIYAIKLELQVLSLFADLSGIAAANIVAMP